MNIKLLKHANDLVSLADFTKFIASSDNISIRSLEVPYKAIEKLLGMHHIETMSLYCHDMPQGQYYHSIEIMDHSGISYCVHDRHTLAQCINGPIDILTESSTVREEARLWDTFVDQLKKHKVRLTFTDEPRRFIGEVRDVASLHRYLNFIHMEQDVENEDA